MKTINKSRCPTFNEILEQTELKNSERLMTKARAANRLAKKLSGTNRRSAYRVKSGALCFLAKKLRHHIDILKDAELKNFVVVQLKKERSGLHLPFAVLSGFVSFR